MRCPRIALVCGNLTPERDGVADYAVRLAAALGAEAETILLTAGEISPGLLTERDRKPDGGPVAAGGIHEVVDLGGRGWGPRSLPAAVAALRRAAPDVVHVQFAPSAFRFSPGVGVLPALTGRGVDACWLVTLHEYGWWSWPAWPPAWAWRRLERGSPTRHPRARWDRETLLLGPRADSLVVTNTGHAAAVRTRLGVEPVTIPLPANVPVPTPRGQVREEGRARARGWLRAATGAPAGAPVLVFFGFVHPVKGLRYLLEALAELSPRHPELRLVVAGGFTSQALPRAEAVAFRGELEAHARQVGVADRVTFTGHRPAAEVSRILLGADVCVLPFTSGVTGRSGALTAALAHAVPTVVTAADPADPDLVDGRTAVVVHGVRDPGPLAAGIHRVLVDDRLRATVAAGGRALVAGRAWPAVADAHHQLYRRLLDARR